MLDGAQDPIMPLPPRHLFEPLRPQCVQADVEQTHACTCSLPFMCLSADCQQQRLPSATFLTATWLALHRLAHKQPVMSTSQLRQCCQADKAPCAKPTVLEGRIECKTTRAEAGSDKLRV